MEMDNVETEGTYRSESPTVDSPHGSHQVQADQGGSPSQSCPRVDSGKLSRHTPNRALPIQGGVQKHPIYSVTPRRNTSGPHRQSSSPVGIRRTKPSPHQIQPPTTAIARRILEALGGVPDASLRATPELPDRQTLQPNRGIQEPLDAPNAAAAAATGADATSPDAALTDASQPLENQASADADVIIVDPPNQHPNASQAAAAPAAAAAAAGDTPFRWAQQAPDPAPDSTPSAPPLPSDQDDHPHSNRPRDARTSSTGRPPNPQPQLSAHDTDMAEPQQQAASDYVTAQSHRSSSTNTSAATAAASSQISSLLHTINFLSQHHQQLQSMPSTGASSYTQQQQQQQQVAPGNPFLQAQQLLAQAQSLVHQSWSATLGQLQGVADLATALQQENQQLSQQLEHQAQHSSSLATALSAATAQLTEAQQAAAAATSDAAAARQAAAAAKERWEGLVVCQICYEAHRDSVLLPCMHFLYCRDCLQRSFRGRQKQCPACRAPVSGQVVVHLNRE